MEPNIRIDGNMMGGVLGVALADIMCGRQQDLQRAHAEFENDMPEFDARMNETLAKWNKAHGEMAHGKAIWNGMMELSAPVVGAIKWAKQAQTGTEPGMREAMEPALDLMDELVDFVADFISRAVAGGGTK